MVSKAEAFQRRLFVIQMKIAANVTRSLQADMQTELTDLEGD